MIYGQFSTKSHNRTYYDLLSLLNIFHQLYNFSLYLRKHKMKFCLIATKKEINNSEFTQQGGRKKRTAKRSCATKVTGLLLVCFVVIFTNKLTFSGLLQKDPAV